MGLSEPERTAMGQPYVTQASIQAAIADQAATDEQTLFELDSLLVSDLKDQLRARGLPVSGRKALLVHRLRNYLTQQDVPFEEPAPGPSQKRKADDFDYVDSVISGPSYAPPAKKVAPYAGGSGQGDGTYERRVKPWRPNASKQVLERLHRALSQRLFLVDRQKEGDFREVFKVFGSTGSIYTVQVCETPSCSCPDAMKGHLCKHLLFVMVRVLGIDTSQSSFWFQAALLKSELADIFNSARPAPNDPQAERVRAAYKRAVGEGGEEEPEQEGGKKREIEEDTDCAVCYESLTTNESLWYCSSGDGCGNSLHRQCWNEWRRAAAAGGKPVTCPHCRLEIVDAPVARPGGGKHVNGYLNLADELGMARVRDTSTYYHGPRRGFSGWESRAIEYGYAMGDF